MGRRIALGLKMNGYSEKEILLALIPFHSTDDNLNDPEKAFETSMKQLFPTTLALSMNMDEEIPSFDDISNGKPVEINILEEEIEFLNQFCDAGIDIKAIRLTDDDVELVTDFFREIEDVLSSTKINIEKLDAYFENDYDDSYTITIKDIKPIVKWVIGILEGKKDLQSKIITILNKYKNKIQSRDILTLFQSIE